jgi:hypothetical protein
VKYEQDRTNREAAMKVLKKRINSLQPLPTSASVWTGMIKQFASLETLDMETLYLLIDKIIVHEARIIDGKRVCDIEVIYN